MRMGGLELVAVLAAVLLFFGPKQLPKLTEAIKNCRYILRKGNSEDEEKL